MHNSGEYRLDHFHHKNLQEGVTKGGQGQIFLGLFTLLSIQSFGKQSSEAQEFSDGLLGVFDQMFIGLMAYIGLAANTGPEEPVSDECIVLATVARDFLGFGSEESPPIAPYGDYLPECPWQTLGVDVESGRGDQRRGLAFHPPIFQGDSASVDVLVIYAPRVGEGWRCGFARNEQKWQLMQCARTRAL